MARLICFSAGHDPLRQTAVAALRARTPFPHDLTITICHPVADTHHRTK